MIRLMRMNKKHIIRIVFVILFAIPGISGIPVSATNNSTNGTLQIEVRCPDSSFISSYRQQKEFVYSKPPIETNFLKRFWSFLSKRFGKLSKLTAAIPWIIKILLGLIILFSIFIIITQTRLYKVFYSAKEIGSPDYHFSSIPNQFVNYDKEIREQVKKKQYRTAIRLLYLKVIQQLRDQNIIKYSKDKTNIEYLRDLSNTELEWMFYRVMRIYNHVWYGEVEIGEEQFVNFEKSFQSIFSAIDVKK